MLSASQILKLPIPAVGKGATKNRFRRVRECLLKGYAVNKSNHCGAERIV